MILIKIGFLLITFIIMLILFATGNNPFIPACIALIISTVIRVISIM